MQTMINVFDAGCRFLSPVIVFGLLLGLWWSLGSYSSVGLLLEILYIASLILFIVFPRRFLSINYASGCLLLLLGIGLIAIIANHFVQTSAYIIQDNIPFLILFTFQVMLIVSIVKISRPPP